MLNPVVEYNCNVYFVLDQVYNIERLISNEKKNIVEDTTSGP